MRRFSIQPLLVVLALLGPVCAGAQEDWPPFEVRSSADYIVIAPNDEPWRDTGIPYTDWVVEKEFNDELVARKPAAEKTMAEVMLARMDDPAVAEQTVGELLAQMNIQQKAEPEAQPPLDIQLRALNDDYDAQWELAVWYIENGIEEADGMAYPGGRWLLSAAKGGHTWAENEVGYGYMHGAYGFVRDFDEAKVWLGRAANAGNGHAAYNIALIHAGDFDIGVDDEVVTHWLGRAARLGVLEAAYEYAFRVGEGVGTERDEPRKRQLLSSLKISGYNLGSYLAVGDLSWIRVLVNDLETYLLEDAGTQDEAVARMMHVVNGLAAGLEAGSDTPRVDLNGKPMIVRPDFAETLAGELCRRAAKLGYAEAQRTLVAFYEKGFAGEVSSEHANYWRERAQTNSR